MIHFGRVPVRRSCRWILLGMLAVSVLIGGLTSCATTSPVEAAREAYSRGDDARAIQMALQALEEEPGLQDARQVLSEAWNRAVSRLETEISRREASDSPWEVGDAIPHYNQLIALHRMVDTAGRTELSPDPEGVLERGLATRDQAAAMHVQAGRSLMSRGTRETAREALAHFQQAKQLETKADIDRTMERARELAMTRLFVFTAADTHHVLNSNQIVPVLESVLGQLDLVEIVTVPARFSAPIEDTHGAEDFARGHGANMMLHVAPVTKTNIGIHREKRPLHPSVQANWEIETVSLEASANSTIRFVLIDLETNTVTAEDIFTFEDSTTGGFSISAILHSGMQENLQLGDMSSSRRLLVNPAASGTDVWQLSAQLNRHEHLNVQHDFTPGISPARYGTQAQIDISRYTHPSELARIQGLNGHTFWLFDVIQFVRPSDGSSTYQMVYSRALGEGIDGSIATAAYDRRLYQDIIAWMSNRDIRRNMEEQFLKNYYLQSLPRAVADAAGKLL